MNPIQLIGELTIYQVAELKPLLKKALLDYDLNRTPIELDLQGLTECDGAGLQLLLAVANSAALLGTTVSLFFVPKFIADLFEEFNVTCRFTVLG